MRHLRFSYPAARAAGEDRHAQEVMRELGITYQDLTPQSIADQFWFWYCDNVPEVLPPYLVDLRANPNHWIKKDNSVEAMKVFGFAVNGTDVAPKQFPLKEAAQKLRGEA